MIEKNEAISPEESIVNFIFDSIFDKKLRPGMKVSESVLAKEFNCSRDVIRKAFSKLVTMGVFTYEKNKGFHVVWLDEEATKNIFDARKVIEQGIVEILAKKCKTSGVDLSHLSKEVDTEEYLKVSYKNGEYVKSSCDFHLSLAILSGNEFLINALKPLIPLSILAALIFEDENTSFCSYDEHREVIKSIESGDAEWAKKVMTQHLDNCVYVLNFDLLPSKKNTFIFS